MNLEEKECPYCKELIKARAIKCRYCGEILSNSHMHELAPQSMSESNVNPGKKLFSGIMLLVMLLLVLAIKNPDKEEFIKYLLSPARMESVAKNIGGGNNGFVAMLSILKLADTIDKSKNGMSISQENYGLYSIFTVDFGVPDEDYNEFFSKHYLGIFGTFFAINIDEGSMLSSTVKNNSSQHQSFNGEFASNVDISDSGDVNTLENSHSFVREDELQNMINVYPAGFPFKQGNGNYGIRVRVENMMPEDILEAKITTLNKCKEGEDYYTIFVDKKLPSENLVLLLGDSFSNKIDCSKSNNLSYRVDDVTTKTHEYRLNREGGVNVTQRQ